MKKRSVRQALKNAKNIEAWFKEQAELKKIENEMVSKRGKLPGTVTGRMTSAAHEFNEQLNLIFQTNDLKMGFTLNKDRIKELIEQELRDRGADNVKIAVDTIHDSVLVNLDFAELELRLLSMTLHTL